MNVTLRPAPGVVLREQLPSWALELAACLEAGPDALSDRYRPSCPCDDCTGTPLALLAKLHSLIPPHVHELARLIHPKEG